MTTEEAKPVESGKIDIPGLIDALQDHVLHEKKMTPTQVSAAIALLKKVLPDLPGAASKLLEDDKAHEDALKELE